MPSCPARSAYDPKADIAKQSIRIGYTSPKKIRAKVPGFEFFQLCNGAQALEVA